MSVVAELPGLVAELRAAIGELNESLSARDLRIAELENLSEESRRSGKPGRAVLERRSKEGPAKPGRKSRKEHGRHGHRAAPRGSRTGTWKRLPSCCPGCGGRVALEQEEEEEE